MSRAPTLLMMMTTSGHYGCKTIYKATLDYLDHQLPLIQWGARVCHIKGKSGHEAILEIMREDLTRRGFIVESAIADWSRGASHFQECLKDQIKMSQHPAVCDNPLVYFTDDDYLAVCHGDTYPRVLHKMCQLVESSPDILTSRFLREQDQDALANIVSIEPDQHLAWHKHVNWQPMVLRSRDFYVLGKIIQDNWSQAIQMHGEALWREVLATLSRSEKKHAVWLQDFAVVANLGVEEYESVAKRFSLTITPNPI